MLSMVIIAGYAMYSLCVVMYFVFTNKWTFIRYSIGAIAGMMVYANGANGVHTVVDMVTLIIFMHVGGAILSPYIFFFTVLPVLLFSMANKK